MRRWRSIWQGWEWGIARVLSRIGGGSPGRWSGGNGLARRSSGSWSQIGQISCRRNLCRRGSRTGGGIVPARISRRLRCTRICRLRNRDGAKRRGKGTGLALRFRRACNMFWRWMHLWRSGTRRCCRLWWRRGCGTRGTGRDRGWLCHRFLLRYRLAVSKDEKSQAARNHQAGQECEGKFQNTRHFSSSLRKPVVEKKGQGTPFVLCTRLPPTLFQRFSREVRFASRVKMKINKHLGAAIGFGRVFAPFFERLSSLS